MNIPQYIWCAACSIYILSSTLMLHNSSFHSENSKNLSQYMLDGNVTPVIISPNGSLSPSIWSIDNEQHTQENQQDTSPKGDRLIAFGSNASTSPSPSP